MSALEIRRADGVMSLQDMGRPGHLAQGLSRGGAMDRMALIEAAALLGAPEVLPGIEMAGAGGVFAVTVPMRIALTGAPMRALRDDEPLAWNASHLLQPGETLRIGGTQAGMFGYLVPAGGFAEAEWLDSQAAHLSIGIGGLLENGQVLALGADPDPARPGQIIEPEQRFGGGTVRAMDSAQTGLFEGDVIAAFYDEKFTRAQQGNRQGVRFDASRAFSSAHAAGLASDMIGPGDIQMTGEGVPFVLMAECQTIGGYPRIGRVLPNDLPRVAQAAPGAEIRFLHVPIDEADALFQSDADLLKGARGRCRPLLRDPATIRDLLSYQLIGGVTAGDELDRA
ncbi:biotin-dependent carboxyltransferase family protein [Rhodalgimonas zhirmunskyi]|uniref:Biotin-dependent carboxyltransferase family protein n=1 Tax=Rhodalgimonas zhirmunskyi TaxID=2964767 RepID=A0AAJ1X4K0_9RHOB|nr:biotin-dependent carboxyltransferase family protein [Rhodoalgimonas zhirmunskyi]MDQ2093184.1 biotin-dependent carboxyltransferase family protein [Rhodoalgimonas zhirmunskyi]